MSARLVLASCLALVLGCERRDECPSDAGGAADAETLDATLDATVVDSGPDELWRRDGGACPDLNGLLVIEPMLFALAPDRVEVCTPGSGHEVRVRVFPVGETSPVYDRTGVCEFAGSIGIASPGDYEIVVEEAQFVSGARLLGAPGCECDDVPDGPHCAPTRVTLLPCEPRVMTIALHCDPAIGPCESATWPWDAAP